MLYLEKLFTYIQLPINKVLRKKVNKGQYTKKCKIKKCACELIPETNFRNITFNNIKKFSEKLRRERKTNF